MDQKVKRGLGVLVLGVLLVLFNLATHNVDPSSQPGEGIWSVITLVSGLGVVICAVVGLVLIAWGLLRD